VELAGYNMVPRISSYFRCYVNFKCYLTRCLFHAIFQDEIEVEVKLLRAGKSVGVVSVDFRKKRTGKLIAQARHTKYLAVSSKL
jgi:acyl-coenzyme A thioesterase 13